MFSLFKGRYGVAERDFNPFVASDISPWKGQTKKGQKNKKANHFWSAFYLRI